jgi:drug/metabolite transporter (DMT)-like permease
MTALATLLVLGSALMHATWNLLAKRSQHPLAFLWLVNTASLILYTPLFLYGLTQFGLPRSAWPFIIATGLLHIVYVSCLAQAYRYGALSIAYPMSRGTGVALVPIVAVPLFSESVTLTGILGIVLIVAGIIGLHARAIAATFAPASLGITASTTKTDIRGPIFALITGIAIAGYSLVDNAAVEHVHPIIYGYMIFVGLAVGMTPYVLGKHHAVAWRELRMSPGLVLIGGLFVQGTYLIILAAMRIAPVSYIVPLREVSVIFAAALGVLLLGEGFGRERIYAAGIIALGVILIAVFG